MIRYRRSVRFNKSYASLPEDVQEKAKKAFSLFQDNRNHPPLYIKKLKGTKDVWEGRIDSFYRFTFMFDTDENGVTTYMFLNIGPHDIVGQRQ